MHFYHMKLKRTVDVPDDQVRKQRMANGRCAVWAEYDGVRVFKFVSEKQFAELRVSGVE